MSEVKMLRGPGGRTLAFASGVVFYVGAALGVVILLLLSLKSPWMQRYSLVLGLPEFVIVVVLATLLVLTRIRLAQEEVVGYTTSPTRREDLPLVDPVSGVVLREAGQPLLSIKSFRSALRQARSTKI